MLYRTAPTLLALCMLTPAWAHADSCGGKDHRWAVRQESIAGYMRDTVQELALGPSYAGLDNSPGDTQLDIESIDFSTRKIVLQTRLGPLVFKLPPRATYRQTDITFALDANNLTQGPQTDNTATVYHELVWQGTVQAPPKYRSLVMAKRAQPIPATLVLQGTGGDCVESTSFQKWVLWLGDMRAAGTVSTKR